MILSTKALALACGLLTSAVILLCGIARLIWPGYAAAFLDLMASIYPGFDGGSNFWQVVVGALYGLVDGFIGGGVLGWLYNRLAGRDLQDA